MALRAGVYAMTITSSADRPEVTLEGRRVRVVEKLGPEFNAMRIAAQSRNWLGLAVGGVKIGLASWAVSLAAKTLLATSEPQPKPERQDTTVQRRRKALR